MKKLLSLPPNLVSCFHEIEGVSREEYFCTSDPVGKKLGSGGGTAWLLQSCYKSEGKDVGFSKWLSKEKRILLHAGGQSRRLPSYAPSGKVLTPIPVFRWKRGQRISQNLLQLQLPFYQKILSEAPKSLRTLIASGDVYVTADKLQDIPEADVVCYGIWVDASLAKNHGVFCSRRETPDRLDFMLQKPSVEHLGRLMHTHLFLMDVGVWLLSDRAIELLNRRSMNADGTIHNYDLYTDFGCSLGEHPTLVDEELNSLSVAILPLSGGEFYHYGTSREMISSTLSVQNKVLDQGEIFHLGVKPHPSIFVQNVVCETSLLQTNHNVWIENSFIGKGWQISRDNIITGVPYNEWNIELAPEVCVDVVPIGETSFALRPYGINDAFKGAFDSPLTTFLGQRVKDWFFTRELDQVHTSSFADIQAAQIFPVSDSVEDLGRVLRWMIQDPEYDQGKCLWMSLPKLSANELSDVANLRRLHLQRLSIRKMVLPSLVSNHAKSVFYQTNLNDMAKEFVALSLDMPPAISSHEPLVKRASDQMFRSRITQLRGSDGSDYEQRAFGLLREGLTELTLSRKMLPRMDVKSDQIVWSKSPVRIDLAGGWTDTPPYCLTSGGGVLNLAIELNGQQPLQSYIKKCDEKKIILRSIDLGAVEEVSTFEQLRDFSRVGSPFSIPKASLALAGFLPEFCSSVYSSLEKQLDDFGGGIELTIFSAVPAGSGLGTSSILASTVLGAVSDFCGLGWDKTEICNRTLVLEQLLTTGGGWQDQYGGVLPGVKLLTTRPGFSQIPEIRWLPENLFTNPEYAQCHLLYYTGITRTAKKILAEIVRGMFLYNTEQMELLAEMKCHSKDLYEAIQKSDFEETGRLIGKTWEQNKLLDSGTNPPNVEAIIDKVKDFCLGCKLPGAGGGGYLYMVAKDTEAAVKIRQILMSDAPNNRARFVQMSLNSTGLQISRS